MEPVSSSSLCLERLAYYYSELLKANFNLNSSVLKKECGDIHGNNKYEQKNES